MKMSGRGRQHNQIVIGRPVAGSLIALKWKLEKAGRDAALTPPGLQRLQLALGDFCLPQCLPWPLHS